MKRMVVLSLLLAGCTSVAATSITIYVTPQPSTVPAAVATTRGTQAPTSFVQPTPTPAAAAPTLRATATPSPALTLGPIPSAPAPPTPKRTVPPTARPTDNLVAWPTLTARQWSKLVKAPDNHAGDTSQVWACIYQFDGADTFRAPSYYKGPSRSQRSRFLDPEWFRNA